MPHRPIIVLADDLTGAAEIAAIAHTAGLSAIVHTTLSARRTQADILIFDTDTRLSSPAQAARRVRLFVTKLKKTPHSGFFKKTDSVLRGAVLAEIEACAAVLRRQRVILVPCNPSLGRAIRDGTYFIGGTPLDKTVFARDPHHPRATANVLALLGATRKTKPVCYPPASRLPKAGLIVGEADSPADVTVWAGQVNAQTLPAGGADFFRAWLRLHRTFRRPSEDRPLPSGPGLLLNGTTAAPDRDSLLAGPALFFRGTQAPAASRLIQQLGRQGFVSILTGTARSRDSKAPVVITSAFARLAQQLHRAKSFQHLLIAGGATASAVFHALGWSKLEVIHVWGPGVVTLQPANAPEFVVTVKPGSYAWPASLWAAIAAAVPNRS